MNSNKKINSKIDSDDELITESIQLCKYAVFELGKKVQVLNDSLDSISNLSNDNTKQQLDECKLFYVQFQEAYDLYFFIYLGQFIRSSHYAEQPYVKHEGLKTYHVMQINPMDPGKKTYDKKDYFWKHNVSYLLIM